MVSAPARQSGDTANGARVSSGAFVKDGTLKIHNAVVSAVMTISCTTTPGAYPVRVAQPADSQSSPSEAGRPWGSVRVAAINDQARQECAERVADAPKESEEEDWGPDAPWPQTPWHVLTVQAGGQITAQDNTHLAYDGDVKLTSPGFTRPVVMHGDKGVSATARIRCDTKPGLYTVQWNEADKPATVWARYRVTAAAADCQDPPIDTGAPAVRIAAPIALAVLAALGAGTWLWLRRRSRSAA
ncbi:hypothetical protein OHU17_35445 (plasmid) [Streptomyces goshikiensis]|uniref:Uncharacterized protein n=1 Tax=Streptomyces goshikiensis TaxID=1942 RepID=A0ABZ1RXQ7_9ACTN|nr:hypothetical protein [Streptomyces goshikiensis]